MVRSTPLVLISVLALFTPGVLWGQQLADSSVSTCDKVTLTRPGIGISYKHTVRNDDYRFSVTVPEGFVGWGGVAQHAPFHGFTIFVGDGSCIVFRIAIHVDLPEDQAPPAQESLHLRRITVGGHSATRASSSGPVGGVTFENINVGLRVAHKQDDVHDIDLVLVTPTSEAGRAEAVFEKFLASFHFW